MRDSRFALNPSARLAATPAPRAPRRDCPPRAARATGAPPASCLPTCPTPATSGNVRWKDACAKARSPARRTWYEGSEAARCYGLESVLCIGTGFGTKRRRSETMVRFQPHEQQGKTGGPGRFGAARTGLWASSPPSYLSAPPAHPVELRARRGRCRLALPRKSHGLVVQLSATLAARGRALGLAVAKEELP